MGAYNFHQDASRFRFNFLVPEFSRECGTSVRSNFGVSKGTEAFQSLVLFLILVQIQHSIALSLCLVLEHELVWFANKNFLLLRRK